MASSWSPVTLLVSTAVLIHLTPVSDQTTVSSQWIEQDKDVAHATTSLGELKGNARIGDNGEQIRVFLGIPFAEPPTGNLRFQAPRPAAAWSGVRDATTFGPQCMQSATNPGVDVKIEGYIVPFSEDCLYLNVYAPDGDGNDLLPVMFFIHGGGFYLGSASFYDATNLATKGVVVVTTNYRLGPFGFLSTEDDVAPGNYGMLDQVMALKWVQQNIQAFGGDPGKVTIFGQSAGAGSVSLLTMSPLAKGLFQRAIMESGSALSPWAISHPAERATPKELALLLGSQFDCRQEDSESFIQCLRAVDATALGSVSQSFMYLSNVEVLFKPRVENVFGFLPNFPYFLLSDGKFNEVDFIIGYDPVEAPFIDPENHGAAYEDFRKIVNVDIQTFNLLINHQAFFNRIKELYLQNSTDPIFIRDQLQQFRSDFYMIAPSLIEMGLKFKASPLKKSYVYEFSYFPSNYKLSSWSSPAHGADVVYMFNMTNRLILDLYNYVGEPSTRDLQFMEHFQTALVNFAKGRDPSQDFPAGTDNIWKPFTPSLPLYLDFNSPQTIKMFTRQPEISLIGELLLEFDTLLNPR